MNERHKPVLLQEVIESLSPQKNQNFVDATVGLGGHASAILARSGPKGSLIGIDQDQEALKEARTNLVEFGDRFKTVYGNFSEIVELVGDTPIDGGILADLGVSSLQLDDQKRGFSFRKAFTLDMRMDQSQDLTAKIIVNEYPEDQLKKIIRDNSDERFAANIAKNICLARQKAVIDQTTQLALIVAESIPKRFWPRGVDPATRTFQAIRMEVNHELQRLSDFLPEVLEVLQPHAKIAIITFHSREDYIVANFFKKESNPCTCPPDFPKCVCGNTARLKIINKKAIQATRSEIDQNPRSRSARLRVAERI